MSENKGLVYVRGQRFDVYQRTRILYMSEDNGLVYVRGQRFDVCQGRGLMYVGR